ncbi:MAG TPA: hypothetical protein PLN94_14320, partial [Thiolinea sp.]|nr:hypothetical protein [Thiolinea sp.]
EIIGHNCRFLSGPDTEPFTHNDIYFTRQNHCELYASHNPTDGNCANNLAGFVNGESLDGQDLVVWPSTTFYHMPRTEDAPRMDAHWSHISIIPRDWHDQNPLSNAAPASGTYPGTSSGSPDTSQSPLETLVYAEDFEQASGWLANPYATDTADAGQWDSGRLQQTSYQGIVLQPANAAHGDQALATGILAGNLVGSYDLDGGTSSLISPGIHLPTGQLTLAFAWYFAHLQNTTADDYLSVSLVGSNGQRQLLLEQRGTRAVRPAVWTESTRDISAFAGQTVQLLIEAADAGSGSLIEAAIDQIRITATTSGSGSDSSTTTHTPEVIYQTGFETDSHWTLNSQGTDSAYAGQWQQGRPEHTSYQGTSLQPGVAAAGAAALVTGPAAGNAVGANDLDGGTTSVRSPAIPLDNGYRYRLELDYYLAHLWNSNAADYLRISVETATGAQTPILQETAAGSSRTARWTSTDIDLSPYAGQTIHLRVEASDGDNGSLVEAGIDNIVITRY